MKQIKNSDKLELNQRPKDNRETLQSSALPAELLSESVCEFPLFYSYECWSLKTLKLSKSESVKKCENIQKVRFPQLKNIWRWSLFRIKQVSRYSWQLWYKQLT